jgi:glycosyltransferase involved in cell wall biosynthesis
VSRPLVSCVVPAFNSERYLREALDSILAQRYRPLDIVVADDGSSDGTAAVASGYGANVRLVTQPTAGPAATRNLGIRSSRGDFIAFLDADDLWHPEKIERQMASFERRPELGVSTTHIQNFWIDELSEERERLRDDPRARPMPGYVTMTMVARQSAFERVGLFDEALWHTDAGDWFVRAAQAGVIIDMIPEVLAYHRMHFTNLSRRFGDDSRAEFVQMVKRSLDERRGAEGPAPQPLRAFPDGRGDRDPWKR